jgi:hypothetical protein
MIHNDYPQVMGSIKPSKKTAKKHHQQAYFSETFIYKVIFYTSIAMAYTATGTQPAAHILERPYAGITVSGKLGTRASKEDVMGVLEAAAFYKLETAETLTHFEHPSGLVLSVNGSQYFRGYPNLSIQTGLEVIGGFPSGEESARIVLGQIDKSLNCMYTIPSAQATSIPPVELSELL